MSLKDPITCDDRLYTTEHNNSVLLSCCFVIDSKRYQFRAHLHAGRPVVMEMQIPAALGYCVDSSQAKPEY